MHSELAEQWRSTGGMKARDEWYLAANAPDPNFSTTKLITKWAQRMAGLVSKGRLHPKASAEMRQWADLTIRARAADAQAAMADALLRLESGGQSFVLLQQLRDGITAGERRPLPPRRLAIPSSRSDEDGDEGAGR